MKNLLLLSCILIAVQGFSQKADPTINSQIGYNDYSDYVKNDYVKSYPLDDSIPPSFTISDSLIGEDITIYVISDEDLFVGWTDEKLIWSVSNFDNWSLNTRLEKDPQNNLYAAVKLDEQSNPNNNFDMFKLQNNGEIEEEFSNWNGPGGNPLIINNPDENIYLGQPTIDIEGAIDNNNITYTFSTWGNNKWGTVYFSKIDADGTVLITNEPIITGINAWAFGIRPAIDCNNKIYIVWSDDMHDITYAYSDDSGDNWSAPISVCYNADDQMNKPDICCDNNNNVHIVWQHYISAINYLAYMKLRPDGSVAIAESHLTQNNTSVWCPRIDADEQNNLHITWAKGAQNQGVAQYTKINGNLDAGGASLTDDELTLIQEEVVDPGNVRYPKCIVDGYENIHTIYEKGDYGLNTPKSFCYRKRNSAPLLRIECPNDSVLFVEMTGSGTNWEGTFTPPEPGIYNVRVSGSDNDGNTGFDFYQFEHTNTNIQENELLSDNSKFLMNYPNPFYNETQIIFNITNASITELAIYNMSGQKIRSLINGFYSSGRHSVVWDGKNNLGESVGSGIYFYKLNVNNKSEAINKCLLLK